MRLELNAPIAEVTVYPDRALVTRRGAVEAPEAGEHEVTLARLPRALAQDSLRVAGRGAAGAQLLGVDLGDEYHAEPPEEQTQALQAEIDRLTRELSALDQRLSLLDQQRGWLQTLGEYSARGLAYGLIRGTTQADEPGRVFAVARDESERLTSLTLDTQAERQRVAQELEARKRELGSIHSGPDRLQATIRVRATSAGAMAFDVSYLVYNAGWSPRYDARVDTDAAKVHFSQQAQVRQWTGEDWSAMQLSISTARPSAAVSLPDEAPVWYLEQRPPMQPRMYAASAMRAPAREKGMGDQLAPAPMAGMAMPAEEPTFTDMSMASAGFDNAGAAQVFRVGGDMRIPSDGQPHTVGLGEDDLPTRLEYVADPSVADGAHLRAVTLNATGHSLPVGALHIFHSGAAGDEYVGETTLDATAEGAPLKLYLGVNDNITVKRELIERDTDRGSLLQGGVRRTTVGYRVTLANRTEAPQRVILQDRLPVSKHERIKVKPLEMRPQPTNQSKLDQLTWELQLAPGEERKVEWRFLVESPGDLDFIGMPS